MLRHITTHPLSLLQAQEIEEAVLRMCGMFRFEPAATLEQSIVIDTHNTVLEFLWQNFCADTSKGHSRIADACADALCNLASHACLTLYALKHAVSHYSAAGPYHKELTDAALDFTGFWKRVFAKGELR